MLFRSVAFSIQPRKLPLPQFSAADLNATPEVLAIRVWMGPWATEDPTAGGIHIAPMIGEAAGIGHTYPGNLVPVRDRRVAHAIRIRGIWRLTICTPVAPAIRIGSFEGSNAHGQDRMNCRDMLRLPADG